MLNEPFGNTLSARTGKANTYLQMAVHEGDSVMDSVRHYRHEDVSRGKQQAVEEHAVQRGVDEVRNRHSMQQLRLFGSMPVASCQKRANRWLVQARRMVQQLFLKARIEVDQLNATWNTCCTRVAPIKGWFGVPLSHPALFSTCCWGLQKTAAAVALAIVPTNCSSKTEREVQELEEYG